MEQSILTALRSTIQERGLTIADVAKAAKVNRTTLSLMLSGVKSPTLRTLCRVCGVLEITIKIENMKKLKKGESRQFEVEIFASESLTEACERVAKTIGANWWSNEKKYGNETFFECR